MRSTIPSETTTRNVVTDFWSGYLADLVASQRVEPKGPPTKASREELDGILSNYHRWQQEDRERKREYNRRWRAAQRAKLQAWKAEQAQLKALERQRMEKVAAWERSERQRPVVVIPFLRRTYH